MTLLVTNLFFVPSHEGSYGRCSPPRDLFTCTNNVIATFLDYSRPGFRLLFLPLLHACPLRDGSRAGNKSAQWSFQLLLFMSEDLVFSSLSRRMRPDYTLCPLFLIFSQLTLSSTVFSPTGRAFAVRYSDATPSSRSLTIAEH